jgi:hypothetical protein
LVKALSFLYAYGVRESSNAIDRDIYHIARGKCKICGGHQASTCHEEAAGRKRAFPEQEGRKLCVGPFHLADLHLVAIHFAATAEDVHRDHRGSLDAGPGTYKQGPIAALLSYVLA